MTRPLCDKHPHLRADYRCECYPPTGTWGAVPGLADTAILDIHGNLWALTHDTGLSTYRRFWFQPAAQWQFTTPEATQP